MGNFILYITIIALHGLQGNKIVGKYSALWFCIGKTLELLSYILLLFISESTPKIKFITNPKDTTSRQGSRVEFFVQTAPAAKSYQWQFQNHLISNENANYEGVLTANLIITKCLPKHKGAYQCVAMSESRETFTSAIAILEIGEYVMSWLYNVLEKIIYSQSENSNLMHKPCSEIVATFLAQKIFSSWKPYNYRCKEWYKNNKFKWCIASNDEPLVMTHVLIYCLKCKSNC